MTRRTIIGVVVLMIAMNWFSKTLHAEQVEMSEEDLIRGAHYIIVGEVRNQNSYWNEDRSLILTDFTIAVESQIAGNSLGTETVVTVIGGEVGDIGLFATHQLRLDLGERVLLFLSKNPEGQLGAVYGEQGKYELSGDYIVKTGQSIDVLKNKIKAIKPCED